MPPRTWYDRTMSGEEGLAPEQCSTVEASVEAARERQYEVEVLGPHAVKIIGRFGEPTLAALEVLLDARSPIGVYAEGIDDSRSAMCLWSADDLYAVTLGVGGRWEHFRVPPGGPAAVRDSWRAGSRPRYRAPHGPLFSPLMEAVELAQSWGMPTPFTRRPLPPESASSPRTRSPGAAGGERASTAPQSSTSLSSRSSRPSRTAQSTGSGPTHAPAEAAPKICQICFTVLPATGLCDYCA